MFKPKTKKTKETNREACVKKAYQTLQSLIDQRNEAVEGLEESISALDFLFEQDSDSFDSQNTAFPRGIGLQDHTQSFWTLEFDPFSSAINLSEAPSKEGIGTSKMRAITVNTTQNKPSVVDYLCEECEEDINLSLILVGEVYYVFDPEKFVREEIE